jgi:pimeloyl-ACP methyl ester carboxylesterase
MWRAAFAGAKNGSDLEDCRDQRLPASRVVIIDAGHFVWEEATTKYASAVLGSITGNRS